MRAMLLIGLAACSPRPQRTVAPVVQVEPASPAEAPPDATPVPARAVEPPAIVPRTRQVVTVTTSDECGWILDMVYFPSGSAMPSRSQSSVLDDTARMLLCAQRTGDRLELEVQGHTDMTEPDALTLSDSRAHVVITQLINRGVPADTLEARGYGAAVPIDRRPTALARAKNRRVQFLIVRRGHGP